MPVINIGEKINKIIEENTKNNKFFTNKKIKYIIYRYKKNYDLITHLVFDDDEVMSFDSAEEFSNDIINYFEEIKKEENNHIEKIKENGYQILNITEPEKEYKIFKDDKVFILKES